jgi:hypothetical protein
MLGRGAALVVSAAESMLRPLQLPQKSEERFFALLRMTASSMLKPHQGHVAGIRRGGLRPYALPTTRCHPERGVFQPTRDLLSSTETNSRFLVA